MLRSVSIMTVLFLLLGLNVYTVKAQNNKNQKNTIIYFEKSNNFSHVNINKDTTAAFFRIVKKGMETVEKRKKAMKKYREKGMPPPDYYLDFTATSKPKVISCLKGIQYLTVSEIRRGNYNFTSLVTIILKLTDHHFLIWKNVVFAPYM